MQLVSQIVFPHRSKSVRARLVRGLSTAELVGIIVIVGILGALGGTYISGLVAQSKANTGLQNAQSLTTTLASALAGGATVGTPGDSANGVIDTTAPGTAAIAQLNHGVIVSNNGTTITYQMNPQIATAASYTLANNSFTYVPGSAP